MYKTASELAQSIPKITLATDNNGILQLIVCRPEVDSREVLESGYLDIQTGLRGDCWATRGSSSTADKKAHPLKQITIMNVRVIESLTENETEWPLAGDQLFVDMNLSYDNIPPGTQLHIGEAILEITEPPHRGCKKFALRFGEEAMRFVNSEIGRQYNFRGVHAIVIQAGSIRVGNNLVKSKPDIV